MRPLKVPGAGHHGSLRFPVGRGVVEAARKSIMQAARHPPWTGEARNMAERFRRHGEAYFRFITTPGVEPTNNLGEQALRFVVIDRRITQGTQRERGRTWSQRIWSVVATSWQQGRSVFTFIHHALDCLLSGRPAPALLPA